MSTDVLERLALACDTSTAAGYRRYVRLAVAAEARRRAGATSAEEQREEATR